MSSLDGLIVAIVPAARDNKRIRDDLAGHAADILASHIGHSYETDTAHLAGLIKRHLLPQPSLSLRFTNLLSRLLDQVRLFVLSLSLLSPVHLQPVLSRKHEALLFLYTLASAPRTHPTHALPTLLPTSTKPAPSVPSPIDRPSKQKSKALILREYRARTGTLSLSCSVPSLTRQARVHLPEHLLLRDTLYLLQGISGKYVQLTFSDQDELNKLIFLDDLSYIIPFPMRSLIHRLAEVGHLYSRVDSFVKDRQGRSVVGMIEQSLCHHLQAQLTEYYRLVAVLESQMAIPSPSHPDPVHDIDKESALTLKRLDVWVNDWRLRMRMMSVCVEGARGTPFFHPCTLSEASPPDAQGGALVNLIHSYTDNGDPFVCRFTDQLLEEVSKPFFSTLHKWLFSGELYDPYNEFFVSVDPDLAHVQYLLHPSLLAGDGDGVFGALAGDAEDMSTERESGLRLWEAKYRFRKDMLPMFVGEAFGKKIFSTGKSLNFIRYSCHDSDWVATREKMSNTGGNIICCLATGDFAEQLMEALGPSLTRPANTLYRHNLTATLETAVRSSNAQNDPPDVLRRLDARMLEYSHGEIGWDVFTLEYKVDAPIDTILDPDSMVKYLKLFNHLWKLKRIESTLSQGWMRVAGATRTFLRLPDLEYDWHQIRIAMAEMIHFIRQMQAYCQLEVIACSWKILTEFFHKREGDLDATIEAHRSYLDRMENLLTQLRDVFQTILQFREATENFYHHCLAESARRDQAKDEHRGIYTAPAPERMGHHSLSKIRALVKEYSMSFSDSAQAIVHALQSHPDLDCRFLGIRLSFSDFYRTKKEHQLLLQQKIS
ncbi:gamma-tubulin complex, component 3 [Chiua virens]|nr:gamma-tubulin complex, component 3 [Chiua virens]